ncbi:hypothetical protein ACIOBL_27670 [Paenibacillus taichungensis]|uniref:hypothetical protein n=1 Tax=Paenibacillus taichungensis TaxID=484184 RepID=UPI0038222CA2
MTNRSSLKTPPLSFTVDTIYSGRKVVVAPNTYEANSITTLLISRGLLRPMSE